MYLLIQDTSTSVFINTAYLHSTMYLLILSLLCSFTLSDMKFTFHYVSINSKTTPSPFMPNRVFTFHYVSINSYIFHYLQLIYQYLHSTMYLLILVTPNSTYFKPSTPTFCRPNISYSYYLTKFLTILSNK